MVLSGGDSDKIKVLFLSCLGHKNLMRKKTCQVENINREDTGKFL